MGMKLQKAAELENNLRTTIEQYETKLSKMTAGGIDVRDKSLSTSGKEPPPLSPPLKTEKMSLSETLDQVKGRTTPTPKHRQRGKETSTQKKSSRGGLSTRIVLALSLCLVLIAVNLYQPEVLSANGICAPVLPGTLLSGEDFASSAPWWVSEEIKIPVFRFFCGGRRRIHVTVESGKLLLREEQNGKLKTLHRTDATHARINAAAIVVNGKRGNSNHAIPAPWVRLKSQRKRSYAA